MVRDLTSEEQAKIDREQARYSRLESERINAMNSRDAKKYSDLCTQLGVEPELPELIDEAKADILYTLRPVKKTQEVRKNRANPEKYRAFLRDAVGCNYNDFSAQADYKRRILMEHFPGRYAGQSMARYDNTKLGAIFKKIVDSAEEIAKR